MKSDAGELAPSRKVAIMGIQRKTAFKMGIAALLQESRLHDFNANLKNLGASGPAIARAVKEVRRINEAIAILTEEMENV